MGKEERTIKDIFQNYVDMEATIVKQLNFTAEHPTTIGGYREEIWKSLFEQIIPKKFSIERSVFIIDSEGNVSNEVDLAIFDEQYTPYIFRYGTLKFIPIEAVAVVIECKSKSININIDNWVSSINELGTSFNSIARMATNIVINDQGYIEKYINNCKKSDTDSTKEKMREITQSSTRPIKILCCVKEDKIEKTLYNQFDFVIQAKGERLEIKCKNDDQKLSYWHKSLNHYNNDINNTWINKDFPLKDYAVSDNSILTLIFQLNQLLMLINNPMLFPHMSYVKLFNDFKSGDDSNSKEK